MLRKVKAAVARWRQRRYEKKHPPPHRDPTRPDKRAAADRRATTFGSYAGGGAKIGWSDPNEDKRDRSR